MWLPEMIHKLEGNLKDVYAKGLIQQLPAGTQHNY
jgi:hypothetical protein